MYLLFFFAEIGLLDLCYFDTDTFLKVTFYSTFRNAIRTFKFALIRAFIIFFCWAVYKSKALFQLEEILRM